LIAASNREIAIGRGLVLAILIALACDPPAPPPAPFYEQTFSEVCEGVPCGWEQISGTPGDVVFERTIHSSVGGITLRGNGTSVRGPAGERGPVTFRTGTLEALVAARCDVGNSLLFEVVVEASNQDGGTSDTVDVLEGRVTPAPDWTRPEAGNPALLTARTALVPGSPFSSMGEISARVIAITVTKTGGGSCTIDRVVLDEFGTTGERPSSTCDSR
jgi:hypothetical protein